MSKQSKTRHAENPLLWVNLSPPYAWLTARSISQLAFVPEISTICPTDTFPWRTVPVITVPCPATNNHEEQPLISPPTCEIMPRREK